MGVCLVYSKEDDDDREMDGMYRAILKKLQDEHIWSFKTNTGLGAPQILCSDPS